MMSDTRIQKRAIIIVAMLIGLVQSIGAQQISAIIPFDMEELQTRNPFFQWQDFAAGHSRIEPHLMIVKVLDGQATEEAMAINNIEFQTSTAGTESFLYPYDAPQLDYNQWYAWQVQLIEKGRVVAKSEARKFIIPLKELKPNKYVSLQRNLNASLYKADEGKLYFRMDENYLAESLKITVRNTKNELVLTSAVNDAESGVLAGHEDAKGSGTNYFELNLQGKLPAGIYVLQVEDTKKQTFQLRFELP